jgi:DNA invertase Pin-like site-specific DNA recombinase
MRQKRACIYLRVSTASKTRRGESLTFDQDPSVQEQPLRDLISQREWNLFRVYFDRASGAKERRPGLQALMAAARRGELDVIVVWRFDRFARSVKQLILALEEFRALGIDFVSHQEALDTGTPMGQAMFTIIAAMAELERSVIRDRVVAGMEHARQHGTRSGKAFGRPRKIFDQGKAIELRNHGWSWRRIAKLTGASASTVRRVCQTPIDQP